MRDEMGSSRHEAELLKRLFTICTRYGYMRPAGRESRGSNLTYYNYGPLGTALRQNILAEWLRVSVTSQENVYCVENNLHCVNGFYGATENENASLKERKDDSLQIRSSLTEGMMSHYLSVLNTFHESLPFGIAQHGLCTANRHKDQDEKFSVLKSSGFSYQMSVQYYVPPKTEIQWMDKWQRQRLTWWRRLSSRPSSFSTTDMKNGENGQQVSLLYAFPWGTAPIETIQNLGDTLIRKAETATQVGHQAQFGKKTVLPSVIESSCCLDTATLVYLLDAYYNKNPQICNKGESREFLQLHLRLAPYKVAVAIPDGSTSESQLKEVMDYTCKELRSAGYMVLNVHDSESSLVSRFKKLDHMGIPFTVVINEDTLMTGMSQLRNQSTTLQEDVHLSKVVEKIRRYVTAA